MGATPAASMAANGNYSTYSQYMSSLEFYISHSEAVAFKKETQDKELIHVIIS